MDYPGKHVPFEQIYELKNPSLPYRGPIRGPLVSGYLIGIKGQTKPGADRFSINLETKAGDIAFHLNPRFGENCVVRNTRTNDAWGSEERDGGLPICDGEEFEILILTQNDHFKVAFNRSHFIDYCHRIPKEEIRHFSLDGAVEIEKFILHGIHGPTPIEIADTDLPFKADLETNMDAGSVLFVAGSVPPDSERFSINLLNESDDIALHVNPRFREGCVVRNTLTGGGWGPEEREGSLALNQNESFECIILVCDEHYEICFDGEVLFTYKHRTSKEEVCKLMIDGDVVIKTIKYHNCTISKPTTVINPGIPFLTKLAGGMCKKREIRITGTPHESGERFNFNFICGADGNEVAFHFDARTAFGSDSEVLVGNSLEDGSWAEEQRSDDFPFKAGEPFEAVLYCGKHAYKVYVNKEKVMKFAHRIKPSQKADYFRITGDVDIHSISF